MAKVKSDSRKVTFGSRKTGSAKKSYNKHSPSRAKKINIHMMLKQESLQGYLMVL